MKVADIKKKYPDEWVVIKVQEENEFEEPLEGKIIAHSQKRDEIYEKLEKTTGDISMFYTGDIPKKGYVVAFYGTI